MSTGSTDKRYPGGIDDFTTWQDNVDTISAHIVNDIQDQVVKIEETLGTNPQGFSGYSGWTIKDRLAVSINDDGTLKTSVSGYSGYSGISGYSGYGRSGYSGTGSSGYSGYSGQSQSGYSGTSGYSGLGQSGYSGASGYSGKSFTSYNALLDAPTIVVDASLGSKFAVQLTDDRMMGNPTNIQCDGQLFLFRIQQAAAGGKAITWDTKYRFSTMMPAPTLTSTANYYDYFGFVYNIISDTLDFIAIAQGYGA